MKGSFNLPRGHEPQAENHCSSISFLQLSAIYNVTPATLPQRAIALHGTRTGPLLPPSGNGRYFNVPHQGFAPGNILLFQSASYSRNKGQNAVCHDFGLGPLNTEDFSETISNKFLSPYIFSNLFYRVIVIKIRRFIFSTLLKTL